MNENRKINKRKVWQFSIAAVLVCIVLPAIIFAVNSNKNSYIEEIEVKYLNDKHVYISYESIIEALNESLGRNIYEIQIGNLDLNELEKSLNEHPWVQNAEVYINKKKKLIIELIQNQPIARIFYQNNTTVYFDSTGVELPVDYVYPQPIPHFTNVPLLKEETKSILLKENILNLSKVILADSFWNAQITQIHVSNNLEFDMSTIMGDFVVRLGKGGDYAEKLHQLYIFFDKGLAKLGWDTYKYIDLRYKNQIVTSPALDYVAPPPTDTMIVVPDLEDTIENNHIIVEKIDSSTA